MMRQQLVFLTSQYPAASHTFIRREVEALRELGWSIETFSVRPPGADEAVSDADKAEADGDVLPSETVGGRIPGGARSYIIQPCPAAI